MASLIYHAGALGDFITTLPAMSAWRRLHRSQSIVLLGKAAHGEIAPRGLFDEVWEAGASQFAPLFGSGAERASPLAARLSAFQSALLFCSASSRLGSNLARLGVEEMLRQDPFPAERAPVVDYHLSLFPGLSFTAEDREPQIHCSDGMLEVPHMTAALHPGSGDTRKNWPLARFKELAEKLEAAGWAVRWLLGPAEEGLALPAGSQAWRNVPLRHLAAALAACSVFVGNDSGITHLAAACGCPTVALFGATDPAVWAPRGRVVAVLQSPGGTLAELSSGTVFQKVLVSCGAETF
jgi:Glycosyltransferase family 9 (heptosyltransferase)